MISKEKKFQIVFEIDTLKTVVFLTNTDHIAQREKAICRCIELCESVIKKVYDLKSELEEQEERQAKLDQQLAPYILEEKKVTRKKLIKRKKVT